jgi:hypothetical protein
MKHLKKLGYIALGALLTFGVAFIALPGFAASVTQQIFVTFSEMKIVIDGKEIKPLDGNGNAVKPLVYEGTTYLPLKAVAKAFDKAAYWDGPNMTAYLGDMSGTLEYPTILLKDMDCLRSINSYQGGVDNYDNAFAWHYTLYAPTNGAQVWSYEALLKMQYSRFKGTLFVPKGSTRSVEAGAFVVEIDGKVVYSSPAMSYLDAPITFDIDVTGGNDFIIGYTYTGGSLHMGDAGFYQ